MSTRARGRNSTGKMVKTVELYHIKTRKWISKPDLQVARSDASSCCHGGYLYIFGGDIAKDVMTNKIERLDLSDLIPKPKAS